MLMFPYVAMQYNIIAFLEYNIHTTISYNTSYNVPFSFFSTPFHQIIHLSLFTSNLSYNFLKKYCIKTISRFFNHMAHHEHHYS